MHEVVVFVHEPRGSSTAGHDSQLDRLRTAGWIDASLLTIISVLMVSEPGV